MEARFGAVFIQVITVLVPHSDRRWRPDSCQAASVAVSPLDHADSWNSPLGIIGALHLYTLALTNSSQHMCSSKEPSKRPPVDVASRTATSFSCFHGSSQLSQLQEGQQTLSHLADHAFVAFLARHLWHAIAARLHLLQHARTPIASAQQ